MSHKRISAPLAYIGGALDIAKVAEIFELGQESGSRELTNLLLLDVTRALWAIEDRLNTSDV